MKLPSVVLFMIFSVFGLIAKEQEVPFEIQHLCDRGLGFHSSGVLDSAALSFLQAELRAFQLPETETQAFCLETIGQYYRQLGFRGPAILTYEKALAIRKSQRDTIGVARILDTMASLQFENQDYKQATRLWQQQKTWLEWQGDQTQLNALQKKIEQSTSWQNKLQALDSLPMQFHSNALKQQEIDHVFERMLLQLELEEEKKNIAYTFQLKREKVWLRSMLLFLLIAIAIALVLFRFFQLKRQSNEELKRLNQAITGQKEVLEQQKNKLEELDLMKSHFFTNISHEFRTPLSIIEGATQELGHSIQSSPKALEVISRNNNNLLLMVNQILDLRKLETGKMKLDLVQGEVISYLKYLLESFYTLAESQNKKLHFFTEEPVLVMDYDPEKLLQVLSNLLSNALKYTPQDQDIYLTVRREYKGAEALLLIVKDSGVGIPQEKIPYIFNRFYQLDDWVYRREESTGIGLALTQELVSLMGGSIEVKSKIGQGTSFFVRLPISHKAPVQFEHSPSELPRKRLEDSLSDKNSTTMSRVENLPYLLLIEDNPDVVRHTTTLLQEQYRVEVARDGQEGLQKAMESIPDLIISDLKMPLMNGYQVCEALKTDKRTSHIPIILVSARADQQARNEGFKSGAEAYLIKPFNREELFIRLAQLIELRRRLQERYQNMAPIPPSDDPQFQQEDAFIRKLQYLIDEHLDDENFGIPEVCQAMAMSRSHLHLKIKALTKRSTSHYIRAFRLMRAQELFRTKHLNVTEVAIEVGFRDIAYFSKSFSAEFGLSPTEFIKTLV